MGIREDDILLGADEDSSHLNAEAVAQAEWHLRLFYYWDYVHYTDYYYLQDKKSKGGKSNAALDTASDDDNNGNDSS
jgi:hypothetical protein